MGERSVFEGPFFTLPSGSKREPWHGQSHDFSAAFQCTMQPKCGHTADISWVFPFSSRYTAIFDRPRRSTAPQSRSISRTDSTSPGVSQSTYWAAMLAASLVNVAAALIGLRDGS